MTEPDVDSLLTELEKAIASLADGSAPLEQLVAAHQRALELLERIQTRFGELKERADQTAKLLSS